VARQHEDLAGGGELGEQFECGASARVVHAQEGVVEDEGEALPTFVEVIDETWRPPSSSLKKSSRV